MEEGLRKLKGRGYECLMDNPKILSNPVMCVSVFHLAVTNSLLVVPGQRKCTVTEVSENLNKKFGKER